MKYLHKELISGALFFPSQTMSSTPMNRTLASQIGQVRGKSGPMHWLSSWPSRSGCHGALSPSTGRRSSPLYQQLHGWAQRTLPCFIWDLEIECDATFGSTIFFPTVITVRGYSPRDPLRSTEQDDGCLDYLLPIIVFGLILSQFLCTEAQGIAVAESVAARGCGRDSSVAMTRPCTGPASVFKGERRCPLSFGSGALGCDVGLLIGFSVTTSVSNKSSENETDFTWTTCPLLW